MDKPDKLDELVLKSISYKGDISRILLEYTTHSIEFITSFQLDSGLDMLQRCDEILLSASNQSVLVDTDILTLITHTYSLYFYQYFLHSSKDFSNASIYLFKSIQIFKQKIVPSKHMHLILHSRVLCTLYLQLFGIYFEIGNHELAMIHIKESLKRSEEIISNCA